MNKIKDNLLVLDIETSSSTDTEKSILKWFGTYSYSDNKYSFIKYDKLQKIKEIIETHDVICGYNIKVFDIPILEKYGISFKDKILVDMWEILAPKSRGGKGRHLVMNINFRDMSLQTVLKTLQIGGKKQENFNYKILDKTDWNKAEETYILNYLRKDIQIEKDLFEFLYNKFQPFKDLLNENDQLNYKWLTTTVGTFAYKVLCKEAGLEEEYNDFQEDVGIQYEGAYVLLPTKERVIAT